MDENKEVKNDNTSKEKEETKEKNVEIIIEEISDNEFKIETVGDIKFETEEERLEYEKQFQKKINKLKKALTPSKYEKIFQNILLTICDFTANIIVFTLLSFLIPWYDGIYSFNIEKLSTFLVLTLVYCLLMKIAMTIVSNYLLEFWSKYSMFLRIPLEAIMLCLSFLITSISAQNILLLLLTFILFTFIATIIKLQVRRFYILRKLKIFK